MRIHSVSHSLVTAYFKTLRAYFSPKRHLYILRMRIHSVSNGHKAVLYEVALGGIKAYFIWPNQLNSLAGTSYIGVHSRVHYA